MRDIKDLSRRGGDSVRKCGDRVWIVKQKSGAECYGCQIVTKNVPPPLVKPTCMPQQPLEELALDLLGPLPTGESLFVFVDYYSKWIEVDVIRALTSKDIIQRLDAQFVRYGIPKTLRTDNASNLAS